MKTLSLIKRIVAVIMAVVGIFLLFSTNEFGQPDGLNFVGLIMLVVSYMTSKIDTDGEV